MPADLETAIRDAYAELDGVPGSRPAGRGALQRESEDLAGASFAGQYDTFLWIRGPRKCSAGCAAAGRACSAPRC